MVCGSPQLVSFVKFKVFIDVITHLVVLFVVLNVSLVLLKVLSCLWLGVWLLGRCLRLSFSFNLLTGAACIRDT